VAGRQSIFLQFIILIVFLWKKVLKNIKLKKSPDCGRTGLLTCATPPGQLLAVAPTLRVRRMRASMRRRLLERWASLQHTALCAPRVPPQAADPLPVRWFESICTQEQKKLKQGERKSQNRNFKIKLLHQILTNPNEISDIDALPKDQKRSSQKDRVSTANRAKNQTSLPRTRFGENLKSKPIRERFEEGLN